MTFSFGLCLSAGWSGDKSEGHSATDVHSSLETGSPKSSQPQAGMPDLVVSATHGRGDASLMEAQPDAEKENSLHQLQVSHDVEDDNHLHSATPEGAAAEAPAEEEEEEGEEQQEWEDEDDGEESEGQSLFCVCVFASISVCVCVIFLTDVLFSKLFRVTSQDSSVCQREKKLFSTGSSGFSCS